MSWRIEQALRQLNRHRDQHPAVERDLLVDQRPKHIQHRRGHDRPIRIQVARQHRPGPDKADPRGVPGDRDRGGNRTAVVEVVDAPVLPIRHRRQRPADLRRCRLADEPHVQLHGRQRVPLHEMIEQMHSGLVGRDLGGDIGHVVIGPPRGMRSRREQFPQCRLLEHGCIRQLAVPHPLCPLSPTIGAAVGEDSTVGERAGVRGPERAVWPPHPHPHPRNVSSGEIDVARGGEGAGDRQWANAPLKRSLPHDPQVADQHPLIGQGLRKRRHAPRHDAAEFRVMCPAGHDEQDRPCRPEHRRHDRQVWQVRPAAIRIVRQHHIARLQVGIVGQHEFDRLAHRPQMHRNVRGVDDQLPRPIEQRAAVVQPLLDVGGDRCPPERLAHLLGDAGEEVVEDFEPNRIGDVSVGRAHMPVRPGRPARPVLRYRDRPVFADFRLPALVDEESGHRLAHESGAMNGKDGPMGPSHGDSLPGRDLDPPPGHAHALRLPDHRLPTEADGHIGRRTLFVSHQDPRRHDLDRASVAAESKLALMGGFVSGGKVADVGRAHWPVLPRLGS